MLAMSSFPGAADGQECVDHVKSRVIAEGAKAFENYKKNIVSSIEEEGIETDEEGKSLFTQITQDDNEKYAHPAIASISRRI